jgi:hypothetical protein
VRFTTRDSRSFVIALVLLCTLILASCAALQKALPEKQRTLLVTATAFNLLPQQGQGKPSAEAWGDPIAPGMHALALSADLIALGLTRGQRPESTGFALNMSFWTGCLRSAKSGLTFTWATISRPRRHGAGVN